MSSASRSLFSRPLVLFRVRGVEIALHPSWLITVTYLSWFFRRELVPAQFSGAIAAGIAVGLTLLFYLFVLLHEFAHTLVALRYRLDPKRIVLFMLGGVSQIGKDTSEPRQEYYVALAGPLASLVIAGALLLVSHRLHPQQHGFGGIWGYLAALNLALAVFNMIPGFPLDGGRVFRSMVWAVSGSRLKATRWASAAGRIVAGGLVAAGIAVAMFGGQGREDLRFYGILYIVLGWFLYTTASAAGREEVQREAVRVAGIAAYSGPLVADIVAGETPVAPHPPALPEPPRPERRREAAPRSAPAKRVTPPKAATRLKAASGRTARPAISTGRPAKKTRESDAAKPNASRRDRRRPKRARPSQAAGGQSGNRAGHSRAGSADKRRGAGRGR